jgi:hypothetical protein
MEWDVFHGGDNTSNAAILAAIPREKQNNFYPL